VLQLPKNEILEVRIKENSKRAAMSAFNLKARKLAMVWGDTILLFNTTKEEFLQDERWVLHELRHILQSRKMGKFKFLSRYIWLGIIHGYHNHPYEVDARMHEDDKELLKQIKWI
jgi:hypothetical protein